MPDCIVPGCSRNATNNLGVRLRKPDTSASRSCARLHDHRNSPHVTDACALRQRGAPLAHHPSNGGASVRVNWL